MQSLVNSGMSLQAVGDRYGLSRERVRQIVGNVGGQHSLAARSSHTQRKAEAEAKVDKVREEIVRLYEELPVREIAKRLGVPDSRVYRVLKNELGDAYRSHHRRKPPRQKYTRADARAAIQRCAAEIGHDPSNSEYARWSPGKQVPSLPILTVSLYASWSEAKVDAGFSLRRAPRKDRRPDYVGPEECVRGVRSVWDRLGHPPTLAEYERHAKQLSLTSSATVRKRLGGWHAAIRAAEKLGPLERKLLLRDQETEA